MKRNWESVVLKAFGGKDFRLTVLANEPINARYQRLRLNDGGLLAACGVHPTMWVRLWFDRDGKAHQRAFTLVDPSPELGEFSLEFALHDGTAARWAQAASPGDTVDATVQGSAFVVPDPLPARWYGVGDAASAPALNSLFDTLPAPATVWLEYAHDEEREFPLRARSGHEVVWLPRRDGGAHLVSTVCSALSAAPEAFYWVAAEAASTRAITKHLRRTLGVDKAQVNSLAYWRT
ncbi:NADPH-dependent ferric siderophore reductase, contains FAD-binding and SIP domains [Asanoa hainanensis]|uniref:NADPH-dependent ferric siderophore reductase, contains FAD-binding and SIP domains n=1 Tax=Asanoa hainanensis TaxID=560556 RepID=A0A239LF08_9ACTN|nr:siderophore-interacting protein [Asanoa hainanensis]SNT28925.1 NADPH-dependent ferric siderophore reductase, contains FAD-binding and SIP domains [Asanoa hainanensis]